VTNGLRAFSPRVERASLDAFLLDAGGLDLLFGDSANWAKSIGSYLRARHLLGSIAVGFSRHRALAIARARRGLSVLPDEEEERDRAAELRLPEIGMSPAPLITARREAASSCSTGWRSSGGRGARSIWAPARVFSPSPRPNHYAGGCLRAISTRLP
jgi:hypothetical protein